MSSTEQDALPAEGMPEATIPTKFSFLGVRVTSATSKRFKIGDRLEFNVSGEVILAAPKRKADGSVHELVQIQVDPDGITPLSFDEPAVVTVISPDGDRDDIGTDQ